VGGFIGHGRGVDKIDEVSFVFRCMRDAAEWGVQLCQAAVCSDCGGEWYPIVVERRGRLAVPARLHKLFYLISGVLTPSAGVSTEG